MGVVATAARRASAQALADGLGVPLLTETPDADSGVCVSVAEDGYALVPLGRSGPGPVRVSFDDPALRHRRRGGHNELLGRAVGWRAARPPAVLDATAGFGRDAFTLADLGCRMLLCERDPLMARLLAACIEDARGADAWLADVASRLDLVHGDARELEPGRLEDVDTIYLDPMFTAPRRALPGKEMQVLAALLGSEVEASDDDQLLAWALAQDVRRVVVKRPRRAPPLGQRKPGHQLTGRAIRFDVYPVRASKAARAQGGQDQ
ncbi:MAG: class I SAM-dependent methyltransferase [Halieaceae bacterium]|nr:class I SAM-dependent methyltransferase [Halieaceae bacterium]